MDKVYTIGQEERNECEVFWGTVEGWMYSRAATQWRAEAVDPDDQDDQVAAVPFVDAGCGCGLGLWFDGGRSDQTSSSSFAWKVLGLASLARADV